MKLVLKILAAPVYAVLTVLVYLCLAALYCSSTIFGIAASITAFCGVLTAVAYSVKNGIILLVIAFLISPIGLPRLALWLVERINDLRDMLWARVA